MALLSERNDLHLTSTGVGHSYNESLPFPPPGFQVGIIISFLSVISFDFRYAINQNKAMLSLG